MTNERISKIKSKESGYPAQLLVLQCQHSGAFCKQFHLDSRERVCGSEVPLGPPAERHNTRDI